MRNNFLACQASLRPSRTGFGSLCSKVLPRGNNIAFFNQQIRKNSKQYRTVIYCSTIPMLPYLGFNLVTVVFTTMFACVVFG